jgi:radical SAM protein with 4Fe4S-binding SPASM domain
MPVIHSLSNAMRFTGKLSPEKLWNYARLRHAHRLSKRGKTISHPGMPASMSVEVSQSCNLQCPECERKDMAPGSKHMDMATFRRIIDQAAPYLVNLNLYFRGEPFLNPEFHEMAAYAHKSGVYTQSSTNGHFLDNANARACVESGLDKLTVSLDGASQESYGQYRRGGDFRKVTDGIARLSRARKTLKKRRPLIEVQCLVHPYNEHELDKVKKIGLKLGADRVRFKSMQLHAYENGHPLLTRIGTYARYRKGKEGKYQIKSTLPNHCLRLWEACVADHEGCILPCCHDKQAKHPLGSIHQESLHNILHGEKAQLFRKKVASQRKNVDICRNCTSGLTIKH